MRLTGYKVVMRKAENVYCNITGDRVQYKMKEWVGPVPGDGPLCVFEDYRDAKAFKHHLLRYYGLVVMACDYEPSAMRMIWRQDWDGGCEIELLPMGTVLADRVRLVCEVNY